MTAERDAIESPDDPRDAGIGELGISYNEVGSVAQALGAQAVDRGNISRDEVITFMRTVYDEGEVGLWDKLGPLIDEIEDGAIALAEGNLAGPSDPQAERDWSDSRFEAHHKRRES